MESGYSGISPDYKYRIGDSYAKTTQKILVDPNNHHSYSLVISDRLLDDYQRVRPPKNELDSLEGKSRVINQIFHHPTVPLYEGYIPKEHAQYGQRFTLQAPKGSSIIEELKNADLVALNELLKQSPSQEKQWSKKDLDNAEFAKSQFRFALVDVRPDKAGILKDLPVDEPPLTPPRTSKRPYVMDNPDLWTDFTSGQQQQIPFGYASFGKQNEAMTNSALCDFTGNYRKRLSTEWTPITVSRADPPLLIKPTEIYHKHIGLLPSYGGHIPGAMFRVGLTYGNDTKDAKRWLRGDFS